MSWFANLLSDIALVQFLLELVASIDELAKARLRDQSALEVLFMHLGARRVLVGLRHLQAAGTESQRGLHNRLPPKLNNVRRSGRYTGRLEAPRKCFPKRGLKTSSSTRASAGIALVLEAFS